MPIGMYVAGSIDARKPSPARRSWRRHVTVRLGDNRNGAVTGAPEARSRVTLPAASAGLSIELMIS